MKQAISVLSVCLFISVSITAQIPSGAVARYPLNANAADASGNGYNGTLSSTTATTNRLGAANAAMAFTAGSSIGSLPGSLVTALQNDFSLGYWFRTSMSAGSSTQWYGGNSMVDAEVCGGVNDWGTALIDGGKVCFGTGNPDFTIKSASSYNDNAWHFLTAVRDKTAGSITLYVDGVQVASSGSVSTGALNAPASIGLASNPCNNAPVYTGSLDDMIAYNRVLSAAEVSNLYVALGATALPVKWLSFTGALSGNDVLLKWEIETSITNDYFEIEHATDAVHFLLQGTVRNEATVSVNAGRSLYSFTNTMPAGNTHYYRIKQVDKDGASAYSKTIVVAGTNTRTGIALQTNPVVNELVLLNNQQTLVQRIQLIDMTGRIISEQVLNTSNRIISTSTHNLQKGHYLLKVITAAGSQSLPVIKQ